MADKEIIINGVDVSKCDFSHPEYKNTYCHNALAFSEEYEGCIKCENNPNCYFKQRARAKKEMEELRQYHNKCCKENTEKLEQLLEKYNQLSRDFYNGKYCNGENCNLLKAKEQECKELKERLNTTCFDPKADNNRCISYNRMAEDYEKDLEKK